MEFSGRRNLHLFKGKAKDTSCGSFTLRYSGRQRMRTAVMKWEAREDVEGVQVPPDTLAV